MDWNRTYLDGKDNNSALSQNVQELDQGFFFLSTYVRVKNPSRHHRAAHFIEHDHVNAACRFTFERVLVFLYTVQREVDFPLAGKHFDFD